MKLILHAEIIIERGFPDFVNHVLDSIPGRVHLIGYNDTAVSLLRGFCGERVSGWSVDSYFGRDWANRIRNRENEKLLVVGGRFNVLNLQYNRITNVGQFQKDYPFTSHTWGCETQDYDFVIHSCLDSYFRYQKQKGEPDGS